MFTVFLIVLFLGGWGTPVGGLMVILSRIFKQEPLHTNLWKNGWRILIAGLLCLLLALLGWLFMGDVLHR